MMRWGLLAARPACLFRRAAVGTAAAVTLIATLASCAAPAYTYATDNADGAYFKVPSNWPQASARAVLAVEDELSQTTGGTFTWSRAYTATASVPAGDLIAGATEPVVYATVQDMSTKLRSAISFDNMRDLLFPVTGPSRSLAKKEGSPLTGFRSIGSSVITSSDGVRGINEVFEYDIRGQLDAFDQTVLTNSATTKLYLLLVQCYQSCFLAHAAQIKTVVDSFTVRGSS
jgi:hypothetical protein